KSAGQVGGVTVTGWDPKTKKEIVGKAKPEGYTGEGAKDHGKSSDLAFAGHETPPADVSTAESMAKGPLRKLAAGYRVAQARAMGDPGVKPGSILKFQKIGEMIDGEFRVDHARHEFHKKGYYVTFKAVRTAKKKPPAQNLGKIAKQMQ